VRGNLIILALAGVFLLAFAAFTAWATLALGRLSSARLGATPARQVRSSESATTQTQKHMHAGLVEALSSRSFKRTCMHGCSA